MSATSPAALPPSAPSPEQPAAAATPAPAAHATNSAYFATDASRMRLKHAPSDDLSTDELVSDANSKGFALATGSSAAAAKTRDPSRWMDEKRRRLAAYDFLCQIAAAKRWMQECINEELPPETELATFLQNGVTLAKVARSFEPHVVRKIFEDPKLQMRHFDNIHYFLETCRKVGLPNVFYFETTDLYALKNFPRVVYTIHAMSHLLAKQGRGPRLHNLVGKIQFTDAEVDAMHATIEQQGVTIPTFGDIGSNLAKEMGEVVPEEQVVVCQNAIRLFIRRRRIERVTAEIKAAHMPALLAAQRAARLQLARVRLERVVAKIVEEGNEPKVVVAQRAVRKHLQVQRLRARAAEIYATAPDAVHAAQRVVRRYLEVQRRRRMMAHYEKNAECVVTAQAVLRMHVQRKQFDQMLAVQRMLEADESLTMSALARVVHMFAFRDNENDSLGLEIENLHAEVVHQIRNLNNIEADLSNKDQKIELLVKNRLNISDLVKDAKKSKSKRNPVATLDEEKLRATLFFRSRPAGRQARLVHEAYQGLFYVLQTQPKYLTRLVFAIANASEETVKRALETFILTLFSYCQNPREEYHLLKVFESIVDAEIATIDPEDPLGPRSLVLNGAPALFAALRQYVRCPRERTYLRKVFAPCVTKLNLVKNALDVDPISINKQLIKEEESLSGSKSKRKYEVTREEALANKDVARRLAQNTKELFDHVHAFFNAITRSIREMPYGVRYVAKYLRHSLIKHFANSSSTPEQLQSVTDDASRCVAHLVFARYMNPAIISPDAYDVVTDAVAPQSRRNLSEVSRILSFICADTPRPPHITDDLLPEWVETARREFSLYLHELANVAEPSVHFHYDPYADAANRRPPTIIISPNEILYAHEIVSQHRAEICDKEVETNANITAVAAEAGDVSPASKLQQLSLNETAKDSKSEVNEANPDDAAPASNENANTCASTTAPPSPTAAVAPATTSPVKGDVMATILDILGKTPNYDRENNEPEIIFTLSSRFLASLNELQQREQDLRRLFAFAKHEIVRVIRVHGNCDSISEMLLQRNTKAAEELFVKYTRTIDNIGENDIPSRRGNPMASHSLAQPHANSVVQSMSSIPSVADTSRPAESTEALNENAAELHRRRPNEITALLYDPPAQTLAECKAVIKEALAILVANNVVTPDDGYASVMRSVANDFRKRHARAERRRAQKASLIATLQTLREKEEFFKEQEKSYDEYIEAVLHQLSANPDASVKRKRMVLPFGKTARLRREIEKRKGHAPSLGSVGLRLRDFVERKIVLAINTPGLSGKALDKVKLTISCDKLGVFDFFASFSDANIACSCEEEEIHFDYLLQLDFDNIQELALFDKSIVFNVQLLIGFINKKFYS